MTMRIARDLIEPDKDRRLVIRHRADPIDTCYGADVFKLTTEDIAALMSGKILYTNNDDYALVLYHQEVVR